MNKRKEKKSFDVSAGDFISLMAFILSVFSVWFSIYQYKDQKQESKTDSEKDDKRCKEQFDQVRMKDSLQQLISEDNLKTVKSNFQIQLYEFKKTDSIKRKNDSVQLSISQQNLKNTVRPLLVLEKMCAPYDNENFGILIKNEGVGPAIIDEIQIRFDNKISELKDIEFFANSINLDFAIGRWMWYSLGKGQVIKNGSEIWLFKIKNSDVGNIQNLRKLDSLLNKHVSVKLNYHSITNDKSVNIPLVRE